ncbi:Protein GMH1 [Wickerhamiella sorbophila]|uniref:Protein GMH1 n=1 Tax=Wickerhamiella sorbophila TaxID=45607 RepID=A0A2T0FCE0_9ASCO|nr:Protein GMH1 [Wickerhamiella sorbophila]PRT52674.1 Protein GMH1 [Wickerhamiella sorbophila]
MRVPRYVRLLLQPPTLDFETAIWEMVHAVIAPRKVFKSMYYRQQTRNQWARDDPSFVVLLTLLLVLAAVAWGLAYTPTFGGIIKLILYMVIVDFLAMGVLISSVLWFVASKFLVRPNQNPGTKLEWAYCFDVHCNAFLIIYVLLYVVQFVLLPIIDRDNWTCMFLGNTLYLVALSQYFVVTFVGYSYVPFLQHTDYLLSPIVGLAVVYVVCLFGVSIPRFMLTRYFY